MELMIGPSLNSLEICKLTKYIVGIHIYVNAI